MDNLLKNHILKCIKIYNPLFTQNIIENKYKNQINELIKENNKLKDQNERINEKNLRLQNQNQQILNENEILTNNNKKINEKCSMLQGELNKQNQKNKQSIVSLENEVETLKTENNKLKKELIISNDKIMCLQMVSNQSCQKQKNNVINEEKKNDENYNVHSDGMGILWGILYGNRYCMTIKGKRVIFDGSHMGRGWHSVYSVSNVFKKGKHKIKIKVLEQSYDCWICIGITSTTNCKNGLCFGKNKDTYNYGYCSNGKKYSHDDGAVSAGWFSGYSSNDVITINIDLSLGIIWFYKNNKYIYETNIKKDKYYMAISMYGGGTFVAGQGGSIEIV
eukprot:208374_1